MRTKKTFTLKNPKTAASIHLLYRLEEEGYIPNDAYVILGIDNEHQPTAMQNN